MTEQSQSQNKETWGQASVEVLMRILDIAMIAVYTYLIVRSNYNLAIIFAASALTAWYYTLKIVNALKK